MQILHTIKQHMTAFQAGTKRNPKLAIALLPLAAVVALLQYNIDPLRRQPAIEPANMTQLGGGLNVKGNSATLPFEYMLGAVSGFRQVIAGLLWVRTDSFFHSGNYDAVLPMLRLVTWLDPNWTDVYATGGWHITYNFTDTDNRSDRRYLPPGLAFLSEGIANNPNTYDLYKEKGWTNYDKVHDYEEAVLAYQAGWDADLKRDKAGNTLLDAKGNVIHTADVTQVLNALGHSYQRSGQVDKAIETWQLASNMQAAKRTEMGKDKASDTFTVDIGEKTANKNRSLLQIRKQNRIKDAAVPVDPQFTFKVTRIRPKVLVIEGSWNCIGSKSYDAGELDKINNIVNIGRGIMMEGPVDGTRVEIRLHDQGYEMPRPDSFSFEVDPDLTILQDVTSARGGRRAEVGGAYIQRPDSQTTAATDTKADVSAIYSFVGKESIEKLQGVPFKQALAGTVAISPMGKRQLVTYAYAPTTGKNFVESTEVEALFAKLKGDTAKLDEMEKKSIYIARQAFTAPCTFKREVDMSKDPSIYSFKKDSYDLWLTLNPRLFPDNVQDRMGWNGEGIKSDAKFVDDLPGKTVTVPAFIKGGQPIVYTTAPLRRVRASLKLTKDDIMGQGLKVLIDSSTMK
jgi:tetratricopeptide (TPR) repeat protein